MVTWSVKITKAPHNEELYYSYFKLVEVVYKALLADTKVMKDVLKYHVVGYFAHNVA